MITAAATCGRFRGWSRLILTLALLIETLPHVAAQPAAPQANLAVMPAASPTPSPPAAAALGSDADLQEIARRFDRFMAALRPDALAAGVRPEIYDRAVAGLQPDVTIPPLLVSQPEHVFAPWDYMNRLVSDTRIVTGRQKLAQHAAVLADVEARHGVDARVVVAIWGVESSFGTLPGTRSVVRSLATLSVADPRRPAFWRKELLTALQILDRGDIAPEHMTGSWAGAMGHTQFMPTSYLAHAVDHDGDGRRDIWTSVPDALASTAAYLKRSGWKTGEAWGTEVLLPAGFDFGRSDPDAARSPAEWQALGLELPWHLQSGGRESGGRDWPTNLPASTLLLPAGRHGPAFLVAANFRAILRYNNATAYALAVGHLSDRLAERGALAALWPIDDPPLDRAGRLELQERLAAQGLDVGAIDGVIGASTRTAVRAWQKRHRLPEDGWPGAHLLGLLRERSGVPR